MSPKYAIGIDFGTESGRALLVDVADGREIATAVYEYANGVIDEALPESGVRLEPDWALQDPDDYIRTIQQTVPAVLQESGVSPDDVIGIGIDFTACTMLPTTADGTPLARLPQFRNRPHAWVKLWKHHAAQPEADLINQVARERGEPWLDLYGGKISSEWFFSKALQILHEDPEIYHAADRLIEAADWVIWQLTGRETRNACTAGYKAIWQKGEGFPSRDYFAALHPEFADIVDTKMSREIMPLGARAGGLTEEAARWTGLRPGTAVAVANVDAHVTVPAAQATEPGIMTIIMGTSNCHMVLGTERVKVPGMCGVVEDGIVPGYYGYEAGQSGVGDIFAWFVDHAVPPVYHEEARRRGVNLHKLLEEEAARQKPGQHGLLALDWWNGNRSTLVDAELSGLLVGATLATTAPDIYRALLESTAYGTREIIEAFTRNGVPVNRIVAAGGLPDRNPLLMQIYADVTNREFRVVRSALAGALGAAMHGAVAAGPEAGGYADIFEASRRMGGLKDVVYRPIPEHVAVYDRLYADYSTLYDYFGRGHNDVMKRLRALRREVLTGSGESAS
ncbi:ribulokinase [Litorilinea aerophila]|uniref:Ribulokinase n=1 Tax=Litorilinea aerophila TaxID=1204385 RepID=A0A540VGZ2_9CHLR|nr:ribulokinase [Litorilinea aerophila]MCC9076423.1 ribulokinase [Litorilinea aerophila]GIV79091.1 MAG: ribulokinase [Litorilinea sp.]